MHRNLPIKLKVANREDLVLPAILLNLMMVAAALLSPYPVLLTLCAILCGGAGWVMHTLEKSKTNKPELISVISADGQLRLESGQEVKLAGILDGQQWCTRWIAVLRVSVTDTTRYVVILSSQQQGADDFRRLSVWLRQGLFSSTKADHVLAR